jgi:predicted restriction endonuclease
LNLPENRNLWKKPTPESRNTKEYQGWRIEVLERDNYKCVVCGEKKNTDVHHIKPFSTCISGRTDVNNGIVLCKEHHRQLSKQAS